MYICYNTDIQDTMGVFRVYGLNHPNKKFLLKTENVGK